MKIICWSGHGPDSRSPFRIPELPSPIEDKYMRAGKRGSLEGGTPVVATSTGSRAYMCSLTGLFSIIRSRSPLGLPAGAPSADCGVLAAVGRAGQKDWVHTMAAADIALATMPTSA